MNTSAMYVEIKEHIERMRGLNPSSFNSIGSVAGDIFSLNNKLMSLGEPGIEYVLPNHFQAKPSIVMIPLFFEEFKKEVKINIWRNINSVDLNKPDLVLILKSLQQEQLWRLTQESKMEEDRGLVEYIFTLFIEDNDFSKLNFIEIEDDIKELFIYYLKCNKVYINDLEITVLNSILYSKCTLTGLLNLKHILNDKIKNKDIVMNLILLASSYLYTTKLIQEINYSKNRNNYLLRFIFSYKNTERMMINEWINFSRC